MPACRPSLPFRWPINFSVSRISSRVRFPDSTSWAMTDSVRPPKKRRDPRWRRSRLPARDDCLKDVGVPDLSDAAYGALFFQPVDNGLNAGVGWPVCLRKRFLNFANGEASALPEFIHDLYFGPCKRRTHWFYFRYVFSTCQSFLSLNHPALGDRCVCRG